MTDTQDTEPHGHLWHIFSRLATHRTLQYRIVHYGFWSSAIFLALMILDMLAPSLFVSVYMWVGVIYVLVQWAEVASRNPLKPGQVGLGIFLGFCPAAFSFAIEVLNWPSGAILTPTGAYVMKFWFVCACGALAMNVWLSYGILQTPYRRDESRAPPT